MQCQFEAPAARAAYQAAAKAVTGKATIPALGTVLMQCLSNSARFTGTDMDMQVSAAFPASGDLGVVCLDAAQLGAFLARCDGVVKFEWTPGEPLATLRSGRSRASIPALEADSFPIMSLEFDGTVTADGEVWRGALQAALPHASTDTSRHYLNGVSLAPTVIQASDGGTAYQASIAAISANAIVPPRAVATIAAILDGDAQVSTSKGAIRVQCGDTVIVSKLVDGNFPDLDRVFPAMDNHQSARISSELLVDALQSAIGVGTTSKTGIARIAFALDGADVTITRAGDVPKGGEFETSLPLEQERADGPVSVMVDAHKLLKCVKSIGEKTLDIMITAPDSPILITGSGNARAVLMPLKM